MSVDVAALHREQSELRETIRKLVEQIEKLNDHVTELLAIARRRQRKRSSASDEPKAKKTAPASVLTQKQREAFDARPNPPHLP